MLFAYENEKIGAVVGSDAAKLRFLQSFPDCVSFSAKSTTFHSPGVFQIGDGPGLLVLPWFLKTEHPDSLKENLKRWTPIFDSIKEIQVFLESKVDLDSSTKPYTAYDLLFFSFLAGLASAVKSIFALNFHSEVTETGPVIKGKWNVPKDLVMGPRPFKFTCTFGSLDKDSPFFQITKSFCHDLRSLLKSRKNLAAVDEIEAYLADVPRVRATTAHFSAARSWAAKAKLRFDLMPMIDFMENTLFNTGIHTEKAGICYRFNMDKYLEELVSKAFRLSPSLLVSKQSRSEILGGANWISTSGERSLAEERKATQASIPDVLVLDNRSAIIAECKYKKLRIPFINDSERDSSLKSFSRNDRNQLLSFALSLKPSVEAAKRRPYFVVIFPCTTVAKYSVASLAFPASDYSIGATERSLVQYIGRFGANPLEIRFIGINMTYFAEQITQRNSVLADSLVAAIISPPRPQVCVPESGHEPDSSI